MEKVVGGSTFNALTGELMHKRPRTAYRLCIFNLKKQIEEVSSNDYAPFIYFYNCQ